MNSKLFNINWKDALHGAFIAVATPITIWLVTLLAKIADLLSNGVLPTIADLPTKQQVITVIYAGVGAGLAYLVKKLITNSNNELLKPEQPK